jgi:hypothetical protein
MFTFGNNRATWINIQENNDLERVATTNPVAFSTIDILSRYTANGQVNIRDINNGEIITRDTVTKTRAPEVVKKAFQLWDKPNVMQSNWEFIRSYMFFKKTFGNAFIYAQKPNSHPTNINEVTALFNVWPQYMKAILTGKYFSAKTMSDIVSQWQFCQYAKPISFATDEILLRRENNISLSQPTDKLFGQSILTSQKEPLSNIEKSYETENIVLSNRGARIVVSPDGSGGDEFNKGEPLGDEEKETLIADFEDYGLLEGQKPALVTTVPIKVDVIDQDIRKLGIFESIANNALSVANAFGVPEVLLKLYIQGATFENQNISIKRMYQDTIIPEFVDYVNDLNDFLKLREFGYEYIATFDHIPVMQEDFKERATANRQISAYYKEQFLTGAATWNEWKRALNQKEIGLEGDKYIYELDDRTINIILNKDFANVGQTDTEQPED